MEQDFGQCSDDELIAVIDAALSALADDRVRLAGPVERLRLVSDAMRLDARLHAWRSALAAQVESDQVAVLQHGTSTATWLADAVRVTRRTAVRLIADGGRLRRFATVGRALAAGESCPSRRRRSA